MDANGALRLHHGSGCCRRGVRVAPPIIAYAYHTTAFGMPAAPHWCYDSTWSVCDHPDLPKHIHTSARMRWLLGQGWWVEPPNKYEECYVAAHADLGYALSATDPDEVLQEACELCEAATSSQPEGS